MENKCTRFSIRLDKMQHIFLTKFRLINWLPTKERVHQCNNVQVFQWQLSFLSEWNLWICSTLQSRHRVEIVLQGLSTLFEGLTKFLNWGTAQVLRFSACNWRLEVMSWRFCFRLQQAHHYLWFDHSKCSSIFLLVPLLILADNE